MANQFVGVLENAALTMNGLVLGVEGGIQQNKNFCLTDLSWKPDVNIHTLNCANTSSEASRQIRGKEVLSVGLFLDTLTPYVEQEILRALVGDNKPCLWTEASSSVEVPDTTNPVYAALMCIKPFMAGGKVGDVKDLSFDLSTSGGYDVFMTPVPTGSTLVAANPTAATIDLTWDYEATQLDSRQGQTRIVSYEVWQSLTTATGFTKVSTTDASGIDVAPIPAGNFYQAVTLTASTAYFFYVVAVDFYNQRSVISAEATTSTTA